MKKIKIHHNTKLFWIIILLLILLMVIIYLAYKSNENPESECIIDRDCVPNKCCHPDLCVSMDLTPDCIDVACTLECSGPLDCNAGKCGCIDNKCEVIK